MIHGAIFYGMSGSGKSRMAKELPRLMQKTAQEMEIPGVEKLVRALQNRKEITIDWQNGPAYKDSESNWSPELIFGYRVAAKYWFPNYNFSKIREIISDLPEKERNLFTFDSVIAAIQEENNAKPVTDRHSMLYIANDEFQTANNVISKEPLSCAIARDFGIVCRNLKHLFVFASFVGVGLRSEDIFVDPTGSVYPGYCIRRLSVDSMKAIVRKELKDKWANLKDLPRLVTTFGGIPRVLEIFIQKIAPKSSPSAYDTKTLFEDTQVEVAKRYPDPTAGAPMKWPSLLSFAGYCVKDHDANVAWKYNTDTNQYDPWTAGGIEKLGFISLRGPTKGESWAPKYKASIVLDTPLMIASMAIAGMSLVQKQGTKEIPPLGKLLVVVWTF